MSSSSSAKIPLSGDPLHPSTSKRTKPAETAFDDESYKGRKFKSKNKHQEKSKSIPTEDNQFEGGSRPGRDRPHKIEKNRAVRSGSNVRSETVEEEGPNNNLERPTLVKIGSKNQSRNAKRDESRDRRERDADNRKMKALSKEKFKNGDSKATKREGSKSSYKMADSDEEYKRDSSKQSSSVKRSDKHLDPGRRKKNSFKSTDMGSKAKTGRSRRHDRLRERSSSRSSSTDSKRLSRKVKRSRSRSPTQIRKALKTSVKRKLRDYRDRSTSRRSPSPSPSDSSIRSKSCKRSSSWFSSSSSSRSPSRSRSSRDPRNRNSRRYSPIKRKQIDSFKPKPLSDELSSHLSSRKRKYSPSASPSSKRDWEVTSPIARKRLRKSETCARTDDSSHGGSRSRVRSSTRSRSTSQSSSSSSSDYNARDRYRSHQRLSSRSNSPPSGRKHKYKRGASSSYGGRERSRQDNGKKDYIVKGRDLDGKAKGVRDTKKKRSRRRSCSSERSDDDGVQKGTTNQKMKSSIDSAYSSRSHSKNRRLHSESTDRHSGEHLNEGDLEYAAQAISNVQSKQYLCSPDVIIDHLFPVTTLQQTKYHPPKSRHASCAQLDFLSSSFDPKFALSNPEKVHYPVDEFPLFDNFNQFQGRVWIHGRFGEWVNTVLSEKQPEKSAQKSTSNSGDQITWGEWVAFIQDQVDPAIRKNNKEMLKLRLREEQEKEKERERERKINREKEKVERLKRMEAEVMKAKGAKVSVQGKVERKRAIFHQQMLSSSYNHVQHIAKLSSSGPLSTLYKAYDLNIPIRVYIRKINGVRGIMTGYLKAFDKHMNLILSNVVETYTTVETLPILNDLKPKTKTTQSITARSTKTNLLEESIGAMCDGHKITNRMLALKSDQAPSCGYKTLTDSKSDQQNVTSDRNPQLSQSSHTGSQSTRATHPPRTHDFFDSLEDIESFDAMALIDEFFDPSQSARATLAPPPSPADFPPQPGFKNDRNLISKSVDKVEMYARLTDAALRTDEEIDHDASSSNQSVKHANPKNRQKRLKRRKRFKQKRETRVRDCIQSVGGVYGLPGVKLNGFKCTEEGVQNPISAINIVQRETEAAAGSKEFSCSAVIPVRPSVPIRQALLSHTPMEISPFTILQSTSTSHKEGTAISAKHEMPIDNVAIKEVPVTYTRQLNQVYVMGRQVVLVALIET